jgi:hypothetical protein
MITDDEEEEKLEKEEETDTEEEDEHDEVTRTIRTANDQMDEKQRLIDKIISAIERKMTKFRNFTPEQREIRMANLRIQAQERLFLRSLEQKQTELNRQMMDAHNDRNETEDGEVELAETNGHIGNIRDIKQCDHSDKENTNTQLERQINNTEVKAEEENVKDKKNLIRVDRDERRVRT